MTGRRDILLAVFDLDDTLYAEVDYVRSGFVAVGSYLGAKRGADAPTISRWLWDNFLAGHTQNAFDDMSRHFGLNLAPADVQGLVAVYRNHTPTISPLPGMAQLLADLRAAGRKLGLISDGYLPAQRLKLAALGLEASFDAVIFTEELGRECWKPCPRAFEQVAATLAVPHERCAYIADNPIKDFQAPNRLGWLSVQFRHERQVHSRNVPCEDGSPTIVACGVGELRNILLPGSTE